LGSTTIFCWQNGGGAAGRRNLQLNEDGKQKEGPEEEEVTACTMAQRKRKQEFIISFPSDSLVKKAAKLGHALRANLSGKKSAL